MAGEILMLLEIRVGVLKVYEQRHASLRRRNKKGGRAIRRMGRRQPGTSFERWLGGYHEEEPAVIEMAGMKSPAAARSGLHPHDGAGARIRK
jgi:hypothetical protein